MRRWAYLARVEELVAVGVLPPQVGAVLPAVRLAQLLLVVAVRHDGLRHLRELRRPVDVCNQLHVGFLRDVINHLVGHIGIKIV